jgi:hypothetical protein
MFILVLHATHIQSLSRTQPVMVNRCIYFFLFHKHVHILLFSGSYEQFRTYYIVAWYWCLHIPWHLTIVAGLHCCLAPYDFEELFHLWSHQLLWLSVRNYHKNIENNFFVKITFINEEINDLENHKSKNFTGASSKTWNTTGTQQQKPLSTHLDNEKERWKLSWRR